ncbi:hypothetical protein FSARC_7789 [Fusarium sarcochroum]|uniref:DUF4038 domain-containing protein n=1 Tax=Fusarium sarcochroum TaxID=1208366 RepID=A0A8H4X7L0_9HYPO|nr:hypothetical protein FSARC_7789 [Fusarium sarcochroum]
MEFSTFLVAVASACPVLSNPVPSKLPWPGLAISSSPKGRYLYRTNSGEPFFWIADTNWELFHRLNRTDVDLYLADCAAKGFNVVQAVVLSKYNVTTAPNFYDDLALDNKNPATPNEAYFSYIDWIVIRAAEYGVLICFVPTWGRWVNGGWYGKNARVFGKYLGKRYPGIPKMMGGDTNGFWADNVPQARDEWRKNPEMNFTSFLDPISDTRNIWEAMMKGFKEGEARHGVDAFVTFQPTSPGIVDPPTPPSYGHNYINQTQGLTLSMDAVQSGHESPNPDSLDARLTALKPWDSRKNYQNIPEMRSQFSGPVMDVENHYDGAHDSFNTSKRIWNASDVRRGFYPAILSGACGITYGNLPVQQSYENKSLVASPKHWNEPQLGLDANASWHEALHWPSNKEAGYPGRLFASLSKDQVSSLEPARQFLSSPEKATDDILSFEADRYVAGMITKGQYWVYSGWGDAFTVDLGGVSKTWGYASASITAQWFNPRKGVLEAHYPQKTFQAKGKKTFTPPSSGGMDFDWLLVLKNEKGSC